MAVADDRIAVIEETLRQFGELQRRSELRNARLSDEMCEFRDTTEAYIAA